MMSYTATIKTKATKEQVYEAIAEEMSDWWTLMNGKFINVGDQAETNFGASPTRWKFEARALNKPQFIELYCCEANHVHQGLSDGIREEWLGTKLVFEISEHDGITSIDFTHIGLEPQLECFDICKAGWDHYFSGSLKKYLERKYDLSS